MDNSVLRCSGNSNVALVGDDNTIVNINGRNVTVYNTEAIIMLREQNEALRSQLQTAKSIISRLTGEIMSANSQLIEMATL